VNEKTEVTGFNLLVGAKRSGDQVNLKSVDPILYPEVSSDLLRIHASLSKVLHASGAGEAIDEIFYDFDQHRVLARDGGDAELFSARLLMWVSAF
jgi:hypothetical protein